jgi:hypothetical protein
LKSVPAFYSKISYFSVAKSIHIFAHQISNIAPLVHPKISNIEFELRACDAITDSLTFSFDLISYISYVPHLIEILQITGDERASKFLQRIAKNSSIQFFVNLCRRILVNSCLLENSAIEPTTQVKLCFLRIVRTLIEMLNGTLLGTFRRFDHMCMPSSKILIWHIGINFHSLLVKKASKGVEYQIYMISNFKLQLNLLFQVLLNLV